jgi:hypothetical protein
VIRRRLYAEIRVSKLALWSWRLAAFALPVFLLAILLHRTGAVEYQTALVILAASLAIAAIAAALAIAALVVIWNDGLKGLGAALFALTVAFAVLALPGFHVARGIHLPAISDVSTDTADPPRFQAIATARPRHANPVVYPAAENAPLQRMHYPAVRPAEMDAEADEIFSLVAGIAQRNGWRLLDRNAPRGTGGDEYIEAVAFSRIMGFPEDISIRVRRTGSGIRVDMRSASRYGGRDFGSNARRIETFLAQLADARRRRAQ